MNRDEVVRRMWEALEPELREQGYELIEVEYGQHGSDYVLRLFIDREGGITLDNCTQVSRFLSPLLDQRELIDGAYNLEVSSPGFDRPVRKAEDFARFAGEKIRLKAVAPISGRKRFKGVLKGIEDGLISIEDEAGLSQIHIENVKKANLDR